MYVVFTLKQSFQYLVPERFHLSSLNFLKAAYASYVFLVDIGFCTVPTKYIPLKAWFHFKTVKTVFTTTNGREYNSKTCQVGIMTHNSFTVGMWQYHLLISTFRKIVLC